MNLKPGHITQDNHSTIIEECFIVKVVLLDDIDDYQIIFSHCLETKRKEINFASYCTVTYTNAFSQSDKIITGIFVP